MALDLLGTPRFTSREGRPPRFGGTARLRNSRPAARTKTPERRRAPSAKRVGRRNDPILLPGPRRMMPWKLSPSCVADKSFSRLQIQSCRRMTASSSSVLTEARTKIAEDVATPDSAHSGAATPPTDVTKACSGVIMNILVAIDDSRFSEATANAVIAQVKTNHTEIKLLHVLEPFPVAVAEQTGQDSPDFASARLKLRDQAEEFLRRLRINFDLHGFVISHSFEEGDTREVEPRLRRTVTRRSSLPLAIKHGKV